MKQQLKPLMIGLCVAGILSTPVFAADATVQDTTTTTTTKVQTTHVKKHAKKQRHHHVKHHQHHYKKAAVTRARGVGEDRHHPSENHPITGPNASHEVLSASQNTGSNLPPDVYVPGQSFVTTGPYVGVPLEFSGSNLIVNNPSVNQDVVLLTLRKDIKKRLVALGRPSEPDRGHLLLSGMLEGQAMVSKVSNSASTSDIDLTTANLDAYVMGASSWISAFLEMSHDNSIGANSGAYSSFSRTINSRVYVNKGFVIIGDFTQSPFYSSFGQMYVPFGLYSTTLVSNPFTKSLGRTKARAITLGYQQQADDSLYASTFIFKGDSSPSNNASRINDGGVNVGYSFKSSITDGDIGVGYLRNLADSVGMQNTGNGSSLFAGFGGTGGTGNETLAHRVAAYDAHARLGLGTGLDFIGEFITAGSRFNPNDLTYNGRGAKPNASDVELVYTFQGLSRPTSVTVAYGSTRDSLALGLPKNRYSLVLNTSYWKNTLQSLEFRRDKDYSTGATSTGSTVTGPAGDSKINNALTAQFDIYF